MKQSRRIKATIIIIEIKYDNKVNGNKDVFLDLYETEAKSVIRENLDMLYSDYLEGVK
ncbi:hypothetical protein IMSAGC007_04363 [Lachnospiraceae bacterium]|jgi:hypothetical protein|nr:hypothetical protein IMSAGC007_04363 [Lachnospiraceae bacterium]